MLLHQYHKKYHNKKRCLPEIQKKSDAELTRKKLFLEFFLLSTLKTFSSKIIFLLHNFFPLIKLLVINKNLILLHKNT